MTRAEVYDGERGVKLVGHRGYFLRKWGVLLNQALINYGLHFLTGKGYDPIQPPFFMKAEYMAKTAQLEQFDEELYKVVEDKDAEDKYLIATSEQPLSAMFADEWLTEKDLPMKFAGYSSCFRKEAGAHGRDAWGLYRIHQFEKVCSSFTCRGGFVGLFCPCHVLSRHCYPVQEVAMCFGGFVCLRGKWTIANK